MPETESDVGAVGVVGAGGRGRNFVESVCLYGGGGTKLIVYSSLSKWNVFECNPLSGNWLPINGGGMTLLSCVW